MITSYPTTVSAGEVGLRNSILHTSAAWAAGDAGSFSQAFAEDALVVIAGVYLCGRQAIRCYLEAAFAGPMRATTVRSEPIRIRLFGDGLAVVVTEGGVLGSGELQIAPERALRATWVFSRLGSDWLISAYHSSRPTCGGSSAELGRGQVDLH